MVKLTALYAHPEDPEAFEEYYANTHLPLVESVPNAGRLETARVVATPDGSEPPYYRIAELYFESMEQMQASLSTPEGQRLVEDIFKLPTDEVMVFFSEVDET